VAVHVHHFLWLHGRAPSPFGVGWRRPSVVDDRRHAMQEPDGQCIDQITRGTTLTLRPGHNFHGVRARADRYEGLRFGSRAYGG